MGNQAEKYIFAIIFAASKDSVAQLVEHLPFKERVLGSSPSRITFFGLGSSVGRASPF
jgi:hypothetical protein